MYPTSPDLAHSYRQQMREEAERHQMARAFRRLDRARRRSRTERTGAVESVRFPRVGWVS